MSRTLKKSGSSISATEGRLEERRLARKLAKEVELTGRRAGLTAEKEKRDAVKQARREAAHKKAKEEEEQQRLQNDHDRQRERAWEGNREKSRIGVERSRRSTPGRSKKPQRATKKA